MLNFWLLRLISNLWDKDPMYPWTTWPDVDVVPLEEALVAVETAVGANLQDVDAVETAVRARANVVVASVANSITATTIVHRARSATRLDTLLNGAGTGLKKAMNLNRSKV
jgi:hypothetical protein